jgi:hypothetical protein
MSANHWRQPLAPLTAVRTAMIELAAMARKPALANGSELAS